MMHRASAIVLIPVLLLLGGCAAQPAGNTTVRSPTCHCRFAYPATWFYEDARGDTSLPRFGLHNYDPTSADHAPIPARFADIGIDWQSDPTGQLYLAATTRQYSPIPARHLKVSGYAATSYAHWTASPSDGGVYEEHVYFWVPESQRDYDMSFLAANPPGNDVSDLHRVFEQVLNTMVIVSPTGVP